MRATSSFLSLFASLLLPATDFGPESRSASYASYAKYYELTRFTSDFLRSFCSRFLASACSVPRRPLRVLLSLSQQRNARAQLRLRCRRLCGAFPPLSVSQKLRTSLSDLCRTISKKQNETEDGTERARVMRRGFRGVGLRRVWSEYARVRRGMLCAFERSLWRRDWTREWSCCPKQHCTQCRTRHDALHRRSTGSGWREEMRKGEGEKGGREERHGGEGGE